MYWITLAQATHPDSGHLKNISHNTLCPESHEPLLFSLLHKLLASQSGIVGPGSIVDAGCHDGVETCWLAASARDRHKCMLLSHLGGIWKRCNPRRGTGSLGMCIRC